MTGTTVGSTTASYVYDGDGKRASKTVSSVTTPYLYDANRGLPVLLEDGTRRYVWGLGLTYEVESSAALVYHVDGLGSVRALTDSTKAVVQTYESDEFGVPIAATGGSSQPFGYTGEQRDPENGLVYLRARYYDPSLGRFLSRDPHAGSRPHITALNRFAYSQNNPCKFTDPSGYKAQLASPCGSAPSIPGVPEGVDAERLLQENLRISPTLDPVEFFNRVKPSRGRDKENVGANWDYKYVYQPSDTTQYLDFGNFHFGVVAAAYGIPIYVAANGAGLVQWIEGSTPRGGLLVLEAPFLDDPRDYNMLLQGYQYFSWYTCMQSQPRPVPMPTLPPSELDR